MDRVAVLAAALAGVPIALVVYITLAERALGALPARWRPRVRPWIWVGPALLFVLGYLVLPSIATAWLSLFDASSRAFVGVENYAFISQSGEALTAIRNNVLWVVFFTAGALVFGLAFALLADRVTYERATKSLIFLPMAVSFVAAGVIWRFVYSFQPAGATQTGLLNALVTTAGGEPMAWLIAPPGNTFALIVIGIWVWTGFAMVILSAALKSIPAELLEAARVDGANEATVFRRVTLPLLGPTIAVVSTTLVIFALKAFDIVYVVTSGNFDTNVLAFDMYKQMFNVRNFGRASAIAILLLAAIVPVLVVNVRRFRFQEAIR